MSKKICIGSESILWLNTVLWVPKHIKVVIEIPQMWLHVTVGAQLPEENIATVEYF